MLHTANSWDEGDEVRLYGCCMNVVRTLGSSSCVVAKSPAKAGGTWNHWLYVCNHESSLKAGSQHDAHQPLNTA